MFVDALAEAASIHQPPFMQCHAMCHPAWPLDGLLGSFVHGAAILAPRAGVSHVHVVHRDRPVVHRAGRIKFGAQGWLGRLSQ